MIKVSRRGFLRTCLHAGVGLGFSKLLTGCEMWQGPTELPLIPAKPIDTSSDVVAACGSDLEMMTRQAIDMLGGMAKFVQPNEKVFIKPNFGTAGFVNHDIFWAGECTKPEIVITVAEECLKAGAAEVTIGEAGQVDRFSWDWLRFFDGTRTMAGEAQRLRDTYSRTVTLSCLEVDSPGWDAIASPYTGLGQIYVPSSLTQADRVISLAVAKTHRWCGITGSLKNFLGVTSRAHYGPGSYNRTILHQAAGGPDQCFLDIVAAAKPVLSIMDLSICCEGNGPHVLPGWWGTTIDVRDRLGQWVLLASEDPVALDATAARVMGQDVSAIQHLNLAYNEGLGQILPEKIRLIGAAMNDLTMEWTPAQHTEGFGEVIIPGLMMLLE